MEDNQEWKSPKYKNWVRGAKGLEYLQEGLKTFVGNKVTSNRDQALQTIVAFLTPGSAVTCSSCTLENLLPEHAVYSCSCTRQTCIQQNSKNCLGSNPRDRRACPNGICGKLYDEIVNAHTFRDPLWKNTDPGTWCSDPAGWSYAKCFQTTLNPGTCSSETDASGLINIILNDKCFQSDVDCILTSNSNAFILARNVRNDLLHSPKMELEEVQLQSYIDIFIAVLKNIRCLPNDQEASQSIEKLEKLRNNQITISLSEEIKLMQVRKDALSALDQLAKEEMEAIKHIEENRQVVLKEINAAKSGLQDKKQEIHGEIGRARSDMQDKHREILTEIEGAGSQILAKIETAKSETLETINADDIHKKLQSTQNAIEQLTAEVQQLKKKASSQQAESGDRRPFYSIYSPHIQKDKTVETTVEKTYNQMKNNLKHDLIQLYRKQHSTIQLSPLMQEEDACLLEFYVKPNINSVKLERALGGGEEVRIVVETLDRVFYKDEKNKEPYSEIYIEADAGMGKTSLSKRLVLLWCHANSPCQEDEKQFSPDEVKTLRGFDFVFLVLLRDSFNDCFIDKQIWNQLFQRLGHARDYDKKDLENVLNEERCLIILDGLDEWTHPKQMCHQGESSIPHRRLWENTTVLTTTRPWKLSISGLKGSQIDQKLEITGFGKESANKLKTAVIWHVSGEKDESRIQQRVEQFDSEINANKVIDLAVIPILLMYMLCLFCDKISLGKSLCRLYCNIVEMLLKRTVQKYKKKGKELPQIPEYSQGDIPQCFRENKRCKKYYCLLTALGELAYKTLFQETKTECMLAFDRSVVKHYLTEGMLDFCLKAGIVTQNKDRRKLSEQKNKVSFVHKTVHEFFASLYLYSAPDKTLVPNSLLSKFKSLRDILEMSKFLVFISGFNAEVSSLILLELTKIVNTDENTTEYRSSVDTILSSTPLKQYQDMFVSCFKEMPAENKVSLCLQDVFIGYSCKHDQYREILQHLTLTNKHNIRSVYINISGMSETRYRRIRDVIKYFSLRQLENVETIYYRGDYNDRDILPLLNAKIKCLCLSCYTGPRSCHWSRSLMEKVKSLEKIQAIGIFWFAMSHSELSEFSNNISQKHCMKQIELGFFSCTDHKDDCPGIELDLSGHSELRKLSLREIPVKEIRINVSSLQKCYLQNLSNQELVLKFGNIAPVADSKITHTNVELKDMNMSSTTFRDLVDVMILKNLQQTVHVLVWRCTIEPKDEFESVKKEIKSSQQFEVLEENVDTFKFKTCKY